MCGRRRHRRSRRPSGPSAPCRVLLARCACCGIAQRRSVGDDGPSRADCSGFVWWSDVLRLLLDELRDQTGPPGLMAGAEPGAVVAVKVLIEQDVVAPVRILLKRRLPAEDGAATVGAARHQTDEPLRELV